MATKLQSWPPPEPPKPPMPISRAQESVLTGTEQAVALVRFIAALPFDERTYQDVSRYHEDRCSFCHTDIERGNASECHFDDCVWDAARRTVQKLRLEGVPW